MTLAGLVQRFQQACVIRAAEVSSSIFLQLQ